MLPTLCQDTFSHASEDKTPSLESFVIVLVIALVKNTVFWNVMPCSVVDSVFEEPVAPIFSAEDEGVGFLQDVDTCVAKFMMS
jgi:hypothetical protein